MIKQARVHEKMTYTLITLIALLSSLVACGAEEKTAFVVLHIREKAGTQMNDVFSYQDFKALDNTLGTTMAQVQIDIDRDYTYKINLDLNTNTISSQSVEQKIIELYKLPVDNTEEESQIAKCPLNVQIPPGHKATITIEWTERSAEGVVNEGVQGQGDKLGSFSVFLGYIEPCSVIGQENIK